MKQNYITLRKLKNWILREQARIEEIENRMRHVCYPLFFILEFIHEKRCLRHVNNLLVKRKKFFRTQDFVQSDIS